MTPEQQAADAIAWAYEQETGAASQIARRAVERISAAELLIVPAARMARLLELERGWQPMETAPLSTSTPTPHGPMVRAAYLLGFCPDESALDPQGCIEVVFASSATGLASGLVLRLLGHAMILPTTIPTANPTVSPRHHQPRGENLV